MPCYFLTLPDLEYIGFFLFTLRWPFTFTFLSNISMLAGISSNFLYHFPNSPFLLKANSVCWIFLLGIHRKPNPEQLYILDSSRSYSDSSIVLFPLLSTQRFSTSFSLYFLSWQAYAFSIFKAMLLLCFITCLSCTSYSSFILAFQYKKLSYHVFAAPLYSQTWPTGKSHNFFSSFNIPTAGYFADTTFPLHKHMNRFFKINNHLLVKCLYHINFPLTQNNILTTMYQNTPTQKHCGKLF